jgi:hypothetical protein
MNLRTHVINHLVKSEDLNHHGTLFAGERRLVSFIKVADNSNDDFLVDGFITFIHVDKNALRIPHGVVPEATEPEDLALPEKAKSLQIGRKVKG